MKYLRASIQQYDTWLRKREVYGLIWGSLPDCFLLIAALLIVTIAAVQPARAETPAEKLVITDDFKNPDSGWDVSSDYTVATTYTGGEYSIFVKRANLPVFSINRKIGQISDVIMEVDIREVEPIKSGYVVMLFRFQDTQNYYALLLNNSNRTFRIIRRMGERVNPLQDWTPSNYIKPESSINRLKIVCKGPQIEAYANGNKLCTVRDTMFTRGYLGFEVDTFVAPQEYLFSNLKIYRGVDAGFLTAETFRDETVLEQRLEKARSDGFNIGKIEYFKRGEKDFSAAVKNLLSSGPTVIYVMCDRSETSAIKKCLVTFDGETEFDEVYYTNFLEYTVSQPVMSKSSYGKGEIVQVTAKIRNTGVELIDKAVATLRILDPSGTVSVSSTAELKPVQSNTESEIRLSAMLPIMLQEGDYSAELSITDDPEASKNNPSRVKTTSATFKVAGSTFLIYYAVLPVIALIAGAMIAWVVTRRKSRSQD
jgi:hypothetical protein